MESEEGMVWLNLFNAELSSKTGAGGTEVPGGGGKREGDYTQRCIVTTRTRLVTLSLTINDTLKWLSSLPIFIQESFWW